MVIDAYLKKYDRDEMKLIKWLKANGADILVALTVLKKFADEERLFDSGHDLDHALLGETMITVIDPMKGWINTKMEAEKLLAELQARYKPSLWKRIKNWITGG